MAGFFDKVIEGINNGANTITESSKTMVEKAKINTAIHNAEEEKKKFAELLGIQAYSLYLSGLDLPKELHSFCIEIEKKDEEIKMQKRNLAIIENRNATSNSVSIPGGRVCKCGFTNNQDSVFCIKCGSKIGEVE